ncbi:MAG: choice-of-anchor B family protein [Bacteroidetes bacterium]|nr:choice-of-anchor B family protein [Bacteroidota bacterium]MDA1333379.1 choice-of-anchor B family protein [Bacteroidota bacterium]
MHRLSLLIVVFLLVFPASSSALTAPVLSLDDGTPAMRDAYGSSLLTVEGDLLVGETSGFSNTGMIHVLRRNDRGSWDVIQTLTSPDAAIGDRFGQLTAHNAGTLVVSSPGALGGQGAVYAYRRDVDGQWEYAGRMTTDVVQSDQFASSLAIVGDRVLVGAPGAMSGAGRVHVFSLSEDGAEMAVVSPLVDGEGMRFGSSIATDGSQIAIGSPGFMESQGRIDLYNASDWTSSGVILPAEDLGEVRLGTGILFVRDRILAANQRANRGTGQVLVYREKGDEWEMELELGGPQAESRAFFGASMAASDSEVWISAPLDNGANGVVYRFDASSWKSLGSLSHDLEGGRTGFGGSVALSATVGAVGMPGHDYGLGSAVVYEQPDNGSWEKIAAYNRPVADLPSMTGNQVDCEEGQANGYSCSNVDMVSFISLKDLRMNRGVRLNDVWGWTDSETGKEYGIVGHMEAAVFIDMSDPTAPMVLGEMPRTPGSPGSTHRDMKVFKDHAFIVADGAGQHGMQVFDMRHLRDWPGEFQVYEPDVLYTRIASSHNMVINESTGYAYAVGNSSGGETCGGALHMIDINDPRNPQFVGCFNDPKTGNNGSGATHDAQCVVYAGPDVEHRDKEVCVGANGTAISIADVTDKDNPIAISQGTYPNSAYVHQGWFTDDHRYFYQNDEADELNGMAEATRTMIWDLTDLDEPEMIAEYFGDSNSTDHNLYVDGDFMYQTNNASGLRIVDIRDRANPVEVAFFDTTPNNLNVAGFDGTWSSYPYFKSGNILVNSRREGLFILRKRELDI